MDDTDMVTDQVSLINMLGSDGIHGPRTPDP